MRFYLIDRINKIEIGKSIEGIKCWSLSDEIFTEHFPGYPIVPGVLLIESMAQLLGFLVEKSYLVEFPNPYGVHVILGMVHKAKFREIVIPGDRCEIRGKLKSIDINRCNGNAKVYVDGNLIAESDLSFVIISKKDLPENKFIERRKEFIHIISNKWHNRK